MAKNVMCMVPALLGALLFTQAAQAGTVGVTLTVDQIGVEVFALQSGATPSYSTYRFSSMQNSQIWNAKDRSSISDFQEFPAPGTWTTSIAHGGSLVSNSSDMPWGTATASARIDTGDIPWSQGNSYIYSFNHLELAPRTGMTVSGHMQVSFQNDAGANAYADATLSTCVLAFNSYCDEGFARTVRLTAEPQGLDAPFSFTFLNTGNSTLPMEWDILLDANAVSLVPEPGAWGMLLAGLGVAGGMGRRGKKQGAA